MNTGLANRGTILVISDTDSFLAKSLVGKLGQKGLDAVFVHQVQVISLLQSRRLQDLLLGIVFVAGDDDMIHIKKQRQRGEGRTDDDQKTQKFEEERESSPPASSVAVSSCHRSCILANISLCGAPLDACAKAG